jgi:hypothetical protein
MQREVTMTRWKRTAVYAGVACLAWAPGTVLAQGEAASDAEDQEQVEEKEPVADKPLPGPKYLNLRWDEDFSYLDGEPGSYQEDFFDPIKNIHLDENWRLSLGGEIRLRLEAETDKAFGATRPSQDTFVLHRYMLHADVKYRDFFRLFAQGIAAFDEDRDLAPRPIDENRWDIQQAFFDVRVLGEDLPLTLRVGRQEMLYGTERFVSPLGWANTRRRFDAAKLFAHGKNWDVDMWFANPVAPRRKQHDRWYAGDVDFYGVYATYKSIPQHGLDAYFFATHNDGDPTNPNGRAGDATRYTFGSRFWGNTGALDYETELTGQWGHWAGDTIQAWSWAINTGYTLADVAYKPRFGLGFDWATGDDDPTDGTVGTFDQLFPLGHGYFGYLDLIGRQNITAVNANISAWPVEKKVKAAATFHTFWLTETEDALYGPGGGVVRRDPTGNSGREVGQELDLTLLWKLDAHSAVLLGYSHFWDSNFIQQTGPSENADLYYVQYSFKF